MAVGGQIDVKVSPVCWKLNEENDQMEKMCDIPFHELAIEHSVCEMPNGFAITGGLNSDMCLIFIAALSQWLQLPDMLKKRYAHASAYVKGCLFVLGGYHATNDSKPKSDSVDFMKLECGGWQNGPVIPIHSAYPAVTSLDDSRVYLLDKDEKKLFELDIEGKLWKERASLPVGNPFWGYSMKSAQNKLLVAGGVTKCCAWYNPVTDAWSMGQQTLKQHNYGSLVHHNSKFLLLGGSCEKGTDEVEEYDIANHTWSVCSFKMPAKLDMHFALMLDMPEAFMITRVH